MSRFAVSCFGLWLFSQISSLLAGPSRANGEEKPIHKVDRFAPALAVLDQNGDQKLSLEEFEKQQGRSPATGRDFRLFDQNHDGFLDRDEFAAIPNMVAGADREPLRDPIRGLLDQIVANLDRTLGNWNEHPNIEFDANQFRRILQERFEPSGLKFQGESIDEDLNGKVNREEARRFLEMQIGMRRGDGKPLRLPDGRLFNYILFLHADENRNDQIERNEFIERTYSPTTAAEEFEKANTDGDQSLSFDEFKNVIGRGTFDSVYEFRHMDTNFDALVDRDELLAGTPEWQRKIAENAFPAFDLDQDGKLSLEEYQLTPQSNMVLPWDWGMEDTDGDGLLSFEEFRFHTSIFPAYDQFQFPLLRFTYFHRLDQNSDGKLDPNEYLYRRKVPDEFFVMNEDGTGWKSLFQFEGHSACGSVAVSPDGKLMAFDSWSGPNQSASAIFVKDLADGEPQLLCSGMMPTWSKDGRILTCSRSEPTYGGWLVELDGNKTEFLVEGWGVQWSPDGRYIAFANQDSIQCLDLSNEEIRKVLDQTTSSYQQFYWNMAWSPSSDRLCFKGQRADGSQDVATVSLFEDTPVVRVHHTGMQPVNADFAWHPRGDRIVFAMLCQDRGLMQLYEFNPDEDAAPVLLKGQDEKRNNTDVCWTPDGKRLIVVSGDF